MNRILISGAGPAGLTTAYWLRHHGFDPVVVERAPQLRRDGYGLDFFGSGYDVAEKMGIADELQKRAMKAQSLAFVGDSGEVIGEVSLDALAQQLDGRYVPIMHYTLEDALYETIEDDVEVRFGTTVDAVDQDADGVDVRFADGTSERFGLVVDAEGESSNLRRLVFGPPAHFGRYMGYYVACFLFDNTFGLPPGWLNLAAVEHTVGTYPTDVDGVYASLFIWSQEDVGHIPRSERASLLREQFADVGWITGDLLAVAPDDIFMDSVTQVVMPRWSDGRVVLVGDAAYCLTLMSGQGSSMALAGGYILAEELSLTDDVPAALANYENRLRPHIEYRQDRARDLAKSFVPHSERTVRIEQVAFKLILRDAFAGPLQRYLYMGESIVRDQMLHRLPNSHGNVLGYRFSGRRGPQDIAMMRLDVEHALQSHDDVRLLCLIEGYHGSSLKALFDGAEFDASYRSQISHLAVVGDAAWTSVVSAIADPVYHWNVRHFPRLNLDAAWDWVREG